MSSDSPDPRNNAEDNPEDNLDPNLSSNASVQPEEEPNRRISLDTQLDAQRLSHAIETPVPESPISSTPVEADDNVDESAEADRDLNSTVTMESDTDSLPAGMEPVYNVSMCENVVNSDIILEDQSTAWETKDTLEHACVSFDFEMPKQQLSRFLKMPKEYLPCLTAAAKRSRNEVKYGGFDFKGKRTISSCQTEGTQMLARHQDCSGYLA